MTEETAKEINNKIANFFYRSGMSFRLADSKAFKDAVNSLNPNFSNSSLNSKSLAGPLLDQQFIKCSQIVEKILETSNNLTLISDGWTNIRGDHIVNFCVKAPNGKPFFHSSINTSGITQNSEAVACSIIEVIEQIGSQKFCCVITDNAPVMRAAWRIIEAKYRHISANGCAAHAMNLFIKDILSLEEHPKTIKEAEKIIKFVMNHHIVKANYETRRSLQKIPRSLTMSVPTRWFSVYTSMSNLQDSKYVLKKLVDDESESLKEIRLHC